MSIIFLKKIKKERNKCFSTMEFIVSIAIIMILGGVFILNYNAKRETFELNNGVSAVVQEVRKAQTLIMAQTQLKCVDELRSANNYGVRFTVSEEQSYVTLFGKAEEQECDVEDKFFPKSIMVSQIEIDGNSSYGEAFVSFEKDTLKTNINNVDNASQIKITFCSKSNCGSSKKTVVINNKGLVTVK